MSKDKIADYDGTTAGNNTDIGGISIAEGMLPSAVNNSMRELTKQLGAFANGTDPIDALTVTGDLTVDTNTLHVDAANNRVGVGTAAPTELLHLNANNPEFAMQAATDGGECAIYFKDDDGNKDGRITYRTDYSGQTDNFMSFFTNGSERLRLDGSGNVGINTTGPTEDLHIKGKDGAHADVIIQAYTGYNSGLNFNDNAGMAGRIVYNHSNNFMEFDTNGSEAMRIDSSGNLLVGTTGHFNFSGDTTEITVGSAGTGTNHGGAVTFVSNNGGTTLGYVGFQEASGQIATMGSRHLTLGTNNTERMRIDASGNLLVGTTTNGTTADGTVIRASAETLMSRSNGAPLLVNRRGSDGAAIEVRNDNTVVGYINANASGMGVYLGGTAAANHLDDYEEIDFSPSVSNGYSSVSYTTNKGRATKIGRLVVGHIELAFSSTSRNSGQVTIEGLPYVATNSSGYASMGGVITYQNNFSNTFNQVFIGNNGTTIQLHEVDGTSLTGSETSGANSISLRVAFSYVTD
jgi:hypothetical protein